MFTISDLLQTSPYLTCIDPGEESPIVFAIDEAPPLAPDVTPPADAAFGVIGLDRTVHWHSDPDALRALYRAAAEPVDREVLESLHGAGVVADLVRRDWLQRPDELCSEYLLTTAQIEVTAHCNWGCAFCPVSIDRKPPATMPMPLFEEIIEKIAVHDTIRYVTFHFYNEPTLDPFFDQRLAVLSAHDMRLRLFTNASRLTSDRIAALTESGVLDLLTVNLPSLDEQEFRTFTGSRTYSASLRNLEAAIDSGLPVGIVANGTGADAERRARTLREHYGPRGVPVDSPLLSDRAGNLSGYYDQEVRITGRLRGCGWPVNHAHFSVTGDMFICCNDYYQRETFGNIREGSVHSIMTGSSAVETRRRVFGVAEAPADYLCRGCHDQLLDFPLRQFRPLASFPAERSRTDHG